MSEIEEELRESYTKFGPVRSVVRTKFGIAAGESRKRAVKDWPERFYEATTYYEHLQLKAADNIAKPKPAGWWTKVLSEAATELEKQGVEKGRIVARLKEDFPVSERSLYRYLPDEYKRSGGYNRTELPAVSSKRSDSGISDQSAKLEPYRRGLSETASSHRVTTYTKSEELFASALSVYGVGYRTEVAFEREGEKTEDGKPKVYVLDIFLIDRNVGIELEGEGSSSKDNAERDAFFRSKGIGIAHLSNELVQKHAGEVAELIAILGGSQV